MIEKIFDLVTNNLKNLKFYIFLICFCFLTLLVFPYIDFNFFYQGRIEKRINNLNKITQIDKELISNDIRLEEEYEAIIKEISQLKDKSIYNTSQQVQHQNEETIKFITGGIIFWILAAVMIFIKNFNKVYEKILAIVLLSGAGFLFGLLAKSIPTILNPWINYTLFPILTVVMLVILTKSGSKK